MIERVIYTEEADDEVAESYTWYESREPGLGEDFLRCVGARHVSWTETRHLGKPRSGVRP